MRRMVCQFLLIGMLLGGVCRTASGQETSGENEKNPSKSAADAKKGTRLELSSNSGPPGSVVVVPIYFTPEKGVEVGSLKLMVTFASASLKFEKLERGVVAEKGNLELSSDLKTAKNAAGVESATLTVEVLPDPSKPASSGIPAGVLGALVLRISQKAKPGAINLKASGEGTEMGSNQPLISLHTSGAQITVAWVDAPPSVTCFFFTH